MCGCVHGCVCVGVGVCMFIFACVGVRLLVCVCVGVRACVCVCLCVFPGCDEQDTHHQRPLRRHEGLSPLLGPEGARQ